MSFWRLDYCLTKFLGKKIDFSLEVHKTEISQMDLLSTMRQCGLLWNFNFHTFLKHPACESVQKGFRAAVFYFLWSNMRFLFVMVSHLLWILTFVCIDITMMNDDFFYIFLFEQLNVFSMFTLKWNVFNLILFCLLPRIYFLFSKTAFDWILNTWIITG